MGELTEESADPVARPVSEHGLTVLARGDEHVRLVLLDQGRKVKVDDRSLMAAADEGDRPRLLLLLLLLLVRHG
jgi:hypothetical protein